MGEWLQTFFDVTARKPSGRLGKLMYMHFHPNEELKSMLEQTGFETVQVKTVDRSEHTGFAHQLTYGVK